MTGNEAVAVSGNSSRVQGQHLRCVVITPVGPGLQSLAEEAKASVEAACRTGCGPFTEVTFVPLLDLDGALGNPSRRNDGIKYAQALGFDWLFFLNADERMAPEAFASVAPYVEEYDAVFGMITQIAAETGEVTVLPNQLGKTISLGDILCFDPSLSLSMGHFVRTSAAAAVRFDTEMEIGEDFRYYLEIWRQFRCIKLDRTIGLHRQGRYTTGPRSANVIEWILSVAPVFEEHCLRNPLFVGFNCEGKNVRFVLGNPLDFIHRHFLAGRFYEARELAYLRQIVPPRSTILEVGANVGNHLVYYGLFMNAEKIIPVEPNPAAIALLKKNIELNHLDMVDESLLGFGVGEQYGHFDLIVEDHTNIGAARLIASEEGRIEVFPLDARYREKVDFIKIDVEWMEMEVLRGAKHLFDTFRPILYIEIMQANEEAFQQWVEENKYSVVRTFDYPIARYFVVVPETHPLAGKLSQ